MAIQKFKHSIWQWELDEKFLPRIPELLSQLEDPKTDPHTRLVMHQNQELWFETKLYYPGLIPLVWLRVKNYRQWDLNNFFWSITPFSRCWQIAQKLGFSQLALPRIYAYGKKIKGWKIQQEVLVLEPLSHFTLLNQFLKENFDSQHSRNSFEDKKELLVKLNSFFRQMFIQNIFPHPDSSFDDFFCRLDQDLKIIFRYPETIQLLPSSADALLNFLAWLYLELRVVMPANYWFRFLRDFLQAQGMNRKERNLFLDKIFARSEQILCQRIKKLERKFWKRNLSFFWFEYQDARIFLDYSIDQNYVLELFPKMPLLCRRREKVWLKQIGAREPLACELIEVPSSSGKSASVSQAFFFSLRLKLENLPYQKPLVGVEAVRGNFLIYQPFSFSGMNLNEYLTRLLAGELAGKTWERSFLFKLARLILNLHERGMVYEKPVGDEIWVEELPQGRINFYLTHLERLRSLEIIRPEIAAKTLSEFLSSLPLSEPDAMIIWEEYLRNSKKMLI